VGQLADRAVAEGAAGVGEGLALGTAEALGVAVGVALGVPAGPPGQPGCAVGLGVAVGWPVAGAPLALGSAVPEAVPEGTGAPGAAAVGDAAPTAVGEGEPPGSAAAAAVAVPTSAVIASTHVPASRAGPNPAPTSAPPSRVRVDRTGCSGLLDHQIGCCGQELYDCCPGGHGDGWWRVIRRTARQEW
jgi:hypothetical protein